MPLQFQTSQDPLVSLGLLKQRLGTPGPGEPADDRSAPRLAGARRWPCGLQRPLVRDAAQMANECIAAHHASVGGGLGQAGRGRLAMVGSSAVQRIAARAEYKGIPWSRRNGKAGRLFRRRGGGSAEAPVGKPRRSGNAVPKGCPLDGAPEDFQHEGRDLLAILGLCADEPTDAPRTASGIAGDAGREGPADNLGRAVMALF